MACDLGDSAHPQILLKLKKREEKNKMKKEGSGGTSGPVGVLRVGPYRPAACRRREPLAESPNTWGTSLNRSWNVEKMSAKTQWEPLSAVSIKIIASRSSPQIKSQDFPASSKNAAPGKKKTKTNPARKVGGVPVLPSLPP